jgi:predicted short-subunit dehydrogenase-like oxidoreductase (DUF2520 family)
MPNLPDIAIIGAGRVGTAIGVLARRAGLTVSAVAGGGSARAAADAIGGAVRVCAPSEAARTAGLVLLTVRDDVIEAVCQDLVEANAINPGAVVAHCSGSLLSDVLAPARELCKATIASCHPLQTFPTVTAAIEKFPGTYCFCEGDKEAVDVVAALAERIGGRPVRINPAGKALYHAAAVVACNYLTALVDAAATLCENAGLDRATAQAALGPLVTATADNVAKLGPAEALTGPIDRGDVETVRRHMRALTGVDPRLKALYRAAGEWTVALALRKKTIDAATGDALRRALSEDETRKGTNKE